MIIKVTSFNETFNGTFIEFIMFALSIILLIIIYRHYFQNNNRCDKISEYLTLKTICDERDRSCNIACRRADGTFFKQCYIDCQQNSPIC